MLTKQKVETDEETASRKAKRAENKKQKKLKETSEEASARRAKINANKRKNFEKMKLTETDEERDTRRAKQNKRYEVRAKLETADERAVRTQKQNEKDRAIRKEETAEERTVRLGKHNARNHAHRLAETPDEHTARQAKEQKNNKESRLRRTPEAHAIICAQKAVKHEAMRALETDEELAVRKAKDKARYEAKRDCETDEERTVRLLADKVKRKAKQEVWHAELAAMFAKDGVAPSTLFGLGEKSRVDDVNERVHDIIHSSAGVLHPRGEATSNNFVEDHGEHVSIKDVLLNGEYAACFLVTMTHIVPGEEIRCNETTAFMTGNDRDPLWRLQKLDIDNKEDLKRFSTYEAKDVVRSYLLAECVSAYDVTTLEGTLQRYIEDDMNMPPLGKPPRSLRWGGPN